MSLKERIYNKLPIQLQHAACSWTGLNLKRSRLHRRTVEQLIESGELDHEAWCRIRDDKLRTFVEHCATTVPFYIRWFREQGVDYREIRKLADLRQLPIIDKKTVKKEPRDFQSRAISSSDCKLVHTSGTTGSALVFPVTLEAQRYQWSVWWRYRYWHGIRPDTWMAQFTSRPIVPADQRSGPLWRCNWPLRQTMFSGNHMSERTMPAYIDELRRVRPSWIHGSSSKIAYLASYIVSKNIDLGYQVKFVTVGAEQLLSQQRKLIENAFGVHVLMHYGLAEAVANVSERPDGRYYVDEDFASVEFEPLPDSPGFRIIGTNFSNLAFPLLRYDTGDIASLPEGAGLSSQFPGRVVDGFEGRLVDYVVLADGRCVTHLHNIFEEAINIVEAQVHQNKPGHIRVLVVRNDEYESNDEQRIIKSSQDLFGDSLAISFEYVDQIKKTKSGKLKFIVSSCEQLAGDSA